MRRIAFLILGAFIVVLSFTVRQYAKDMSLAAVNPQGSEQLAFYLIFYILLAVGLILIVLGVIYPFKKTEG
jgi:uncharacterized Tic20 family protein